jgi:hypothetical protein
MNRKNFPPCSQITNIEIKQELDQIKITFMVSLVATFVALETLSHHGQIQKVLPLIIEI